MKNYTFLFESKSITFPNDEINTLKKQNYFITTRVSTDFDKYHVGDIVITPWNKKFIIAKRVDLKDITQHPYYNELTQQQINLLSKYHKICVLWAKEYKE